LARSDWCRSPALRAKRGGKVALFAQSPPFARRRACPASGASALGAGLLQENRNIRQYQIKRVLVLKLVYCETSRWQRFCVGRIWPKHSLRSRATLRRSRNPTRNVVMPTCLSDYASLPKVGSLGDPTYGSNVSIPTGFNTRSVALASRFCKGSMCDSSPALGFATIEAGHTPIHHNHRLGHALVAQLGAFRKRALCLLLSPGHALKLGALFLHDFFLMIGDFRVRQQTDTLHMGFQA